MHAAEDPHDAQGVVPIRPKTPRVPASHCSAYVRHLMQASFKAISGGFAIGADASKIGLALSEYGSSGFRQMDTP